VIENGGRREYESKELAAVRRCLGCVAQLLKTTWSNARTDSEIYWREGGYYCCSLSWIVGFVNMEILRNKKTLHFTSAQPLRTMLDTRVPEWQNSSHPPGPRPPRVWSGH
jgi:hypothetical protein